jgi:mycothiol synthase
MDADPLLPPGFRLRRPQAADLPAITRLSAADETAALGLTHRTQAEMASWWRLPRADPARDAWLALASDGTPAGYVIVWYEEPGSAMLAFLAVDPRQAARGIGAALLSLTERRVAEQAAAESLPGLRLGAYCDARDAGRRALLLRLGFTKVREYHRMAVDLREGMEGPRWPDGVVARPFCRDLDEGAVKAAIDEAFAEHYRYAPETLEDWRRRAYERHAVDVGLWPVAWDGDQVAGVAQAVAHGREGHVEVLGVRLAWRGRGLGMALLRATLVALRERGCRNAWLNVDTGNVTWATRLYERAGMHTVARRDFFEKAVSAARSGRRPPAVEAST